MIREREAIAIAADRWRASACKRAAHSRAKKKEVVEWIRECDAIAVAADRRRAIAVAADRRRASAHESMARIRAKKKEARHAAVEVEASTTPPTTTKTTMEAVAGVVADGTTTTMRAVVPSMTATTMTMRTGMAVFPTPTSTPSALSSVQKGAVEEMRTERTKRLTASAGRGGNVDDGGNDIHDPLPDVKVVGLTGDDCDNENDSAHVFGVPLIRHSATILRLCIQSSLRSGVNDIFFNLALCVVLLGRAFLDIREGE